MTYLRQYVFESTSNRIPRKQRLVGWSLLVSPTGVSSVDVSVGSVTEKKNE